MAAIDKIYRSILVAARFFPRGWGPTHVYESLARFNPILVDHNECSAALESHCHEISLTEVNRSSWGTTYVGNFRSPTSTLLPNMLPPEAETARFELLLPTNWKSEYCNQKPIYVHLAGTGDHGFYRRRTMTALPLLKKEGFGAVILENPFYGSRKPQGQTLSQVFHVSDLLALGLSLMLESLVLKRWLEKQGLGPVGLTGISMGGHNASLSATVWPEAVPVVPCLSWSTASSVFTQGMLSGAVCWDVLEEQLMHSRTSSDKIRKKIFDFAIERQASLNGTSGPHNNTPSPQQQDQLRRQLLPDSSSSKKRTVLMATTGTTTSSSSCSSEKTQERVFSADHMANLKDCYHSWVSTKKSREGSHLHWETVSTLKAVLDLSTHLYNYPTPLASNLAQFVVAKDDLYIPRQNIASVQEIWPGCKVSYVQGGHVSATLLQQKAFQAALITKMKERLKHYM